MMRLALRVGGALLCAACSSGGGGPAGDGFGNMPGTGAAPGTGGMPPATGGAGGMGATGGIIGQGGTGGGLIMGQGGSGGEGGRQGCAKAQIESDFVPANILFLIDRSGSMNCNLPPMQSSSDCEMTPQAVDATQPTKWSVVTATLSDAMGQLPQGAWAGINYFSNDNICGVQSAPQVPIQLVDTAHLDALRLNLSTITPRGGTPIIGATILGYKHLYQQAVVPIPSNSFLVVLSDGADTCDPDQAGRLLNEEIPKALSVNIRTFAIGVPGSENGRALLSSMAWAGGTAKNPACDHSASARDVGDCHVDLTQSTDLGADLANALADITGKTITCEFDVPANPDGQAVDTSRVNVDYYAGGGADLTSIPRDDTADCDAGADGWQYADGETKIKLCGPACSTVKGDPGARVEIVLGCETIVR